MTFHTAIRSLAEARPYPVYFDFDSWIDPAPLQQAWAIKDEIIFD